MRKSVIAAACVLAGCGGSQFTAGFAVDGGTPDALPAAEATPEAAQQQGEDGGPDARVDAVGHVVHDGGDAGSEAAAPPVCVTDLSGVGTGDFHVAFTLTTTAHADVALLSQRIGCDQSSMLWGVSLNYNGQIAAATDDGVMAHWVATTGANSVADGSPHTIVFARTAGKIWISRDGVVDSISVDDPYSIGALAPLRIGTDDCSSFWSAQRAGAVISNVCISEP